MQCPGSVWLSKDAPDTSSKYAEEGTVAHLLAALCLTEGFDAHVFVGQALEDDPTGAIITDDMAKAVQVYLDNVRERSSGGGLLVEQRVDFSTYIQQPDSFGTADAVHVSEDCTTLRVVDLKYGRGVPVYAEQNPQLMLYALGALELYSLTADIRTVILEIHQPRIEHLDSWSLSVDDLLEFAKTAKAAAARVRQVFDAGMVRAEDLQDGEHCRFCKAKATCPKLSATVETNLGLPLSAVAQFDDLTASPLQKLTDLTLADLATAMRSVSLVEQWCSGVRAETERRLLAGESVEGYKLVEGKRGNRRWINEEQAEKYLRGACKHDTIYKSVLHSPAVILDPKRGPKLGPRQLKTVAAMVTQDQGKPSVAPDSDKRPALVLASAEHFDAVGVDDLC